jgi:hypothetical protein
MIRRRKQHIHTNNLHSLFNATVVINLTLRDGGTFQTNDKWNLYRIQTETSREEST